MKKLMVVVSSLVTLVTAAADPVCLYWTGAAGDKTIATAGNWADEEGNTITSFGTDLNDLLIFTNEVTGLIANSKKRYGGFWAKEGARFAIGSGQTINLGPFGLRHDGAGLCYLGYTTSLYNGTNVIHISRTDGEVQIENSLNAQASSMIVKEGPGMLTTVNSYGSTINDFHEMVMRGGTWKIMSPDAKIAGLQNMTLTFDGACADARISRKKPSSGAAVSLPFSSINETASVIDTAHGFTDDGKAYTLNVTKTSYFSGTIYSKMSFAWNPSDATQTFTFAKATHPTTGDFTVGGGTVLLVDGACFTSIGTLTVASGATLSLAEGTSMYVLSATVGDTALGPGVHPGGSVTGLVGNGKVIVLGTDAEESEATWTGNGSDDSVTNPENWGEVGATELPDLYDGGLLVRIPAEASLAVPEGTMCFFRGIVLSSDGAVTVTGDETANILLKSGGVTNAGAGKLTFDVPLTVCGEQTWEMTGNVELTAKAVTASISGLIEKSGAGTLIVRSSNLRFPALTAKVGAVHAYADTALGVKGTSVRISGGQLQLYDCSLDNDITIDNQTKSASPGLTVYEGDCVVNGKVTSTQPNVENFRLRNDATLTLHGGMEYLSNNNGASYSPDGVFHLTVEDEPVNVTKMLLGCSDPNAANMSTYLHLNAVSNRFPRGLILRGKTTQSNTLYTGVPYAIYPDGTGGVSFHSDATKSEWDLCGCDQGASVFFSRCVGAKVTSAAPATLHLVDDALNYVKPTERDNKNMSWSIQGTASQVDRTSFDGAASFSKEGALTHYMMGVSTSTGAVSVAKGRLVFTRESATAVTLPQTTTITGQEKDGYTFTPLTGSWTQAGEVVVTGGTLELQHGKVFSKVTDVKVSGAGVIELAEGVVQKCHTLTIGDTTYDSGTWGGPESDAQNKDEHLSSKGKLLVVGSGLGMTLIFR